jgi:four helix bundle protein
MRRAAVSIPSNIAEGKGRGTDRAFTNFLFNARGSLLELETQIEIARSLGYLDVNCVDQLLAQTKTVGGSLAGLINALSTKHTGDQADDRRPTTDDCYV